jgi:hypothetical protein
MCLLCVLYEYNELQEQRKYEQYCVMSVPPITGTSVSGSISDVRYTRNICINHRHVKNRYVSAISEHTSFVDKVPRLNL